MFGFLKSQLSFINKEKQFTLALLKHLVEGMFTSTRKAYSILVLTRLFKKQAPFEIAA